MTNRTREAALEFLEYIEKKGLMAPATAQARRVAVNKVFAILDDNEARDVTALDLDEIMRRFSNLQGKDLTPESLRTYKSRLKSAISDFGSYVENPLAFKPTVQTREKKTAARNDPPEQREPNAESSRTDQPSYQTGPMAGSILPIPIRAGLTVYIQGLPFDLTAGEARRIAGVVTAMAISD
jgi:hypothetical protein